MSFNDIQLPEDIERGATGGPRFKTEIFQLSSGQEQRNISWERSRGSWELGYGVQDKAAFTIVQNFFYIQVGMAHSFRFKDWSDFEMARQSIGVTDTSTSTFQLFKNYLFGSFTFARVLEKPLATGVLAWVNSASQTVVYDTPPSATEVSINTLTGVVTLGSTHVATTGQSVEIQCEFDVPVRFDTDEFNINLLMFNAGSIPDLPIIEVRGE